MNATQRQVTADLWTKPIGLSHKQPVLPHHHHLLLLNPMTMTYDNEVYFILVTQQQSNR